MNTTKRFFLGALSSLLFAIGFTRAADRLDPMAHSSGVKSAIIEGQAAGCEGCDYMGR